MNHKELLKGNTESMLLALLVSGPMYGYQLVREIERRSCGYFQFKEGTLYPALHRLEQSSMIRGVWLTSGSGQQRRYYAITERGHRALESKADEWRLFSQAVDQVMAPSPVSGASAES